MAEEDVDVRGEIVRLGKGFMGMLSTFFGGITDFFEWASGARSRRNVEANVAQAGPNVLIRPELQEVPQFPEAMDELDIVAGLERATNEVILAAELEPKCPDGVPYNCLLNCECPHLWYVVAVGVHIGIYGMPVEVEKFMNDIPHNKRKKFNMEMDASRWLEQEYLYNVHAHQNTPHRRNVLYVGPDMYGYDLLLCSCFQDVFCNNDYT